MQPIAANSLKNPPVPPACCSQASMFSKNPESAVAEKELVLRAVLGNQDVMIR